MLIATNDYIRGILNALLENIDTVNMIEVVEDDRVFYKFPECRVTIHFMKGQRELERMVRTGKHRYGREEKDEERRDRKTM